MGIFCVVLLLYAPATAYKSRKETVETASDLFPYEFPEVVGLRALYPVTTGALKPTFATIYTPAGGDISFYIAPAEHCQAVYVCFSSSMIENNEGEIERFHVDEICQESLRFLTLEQTVYHTSNGETKAYVHFTALVELIQLENDGEMVYKYEAWSEMTTEDVAELERTVTIRFDLEGKKIVLLTSSPYCHVTLDQEYTKALVGHRIVFEPRKNVSNYLKFHGDNGVVHYTHYIVSGSAAGSTIRSGVRRSSSFFDPTRRFSEPYDCCTDPTEFEGFIGDAYWDPEYLRPKFNRYFLTTVRRNENVCRGDEILDGENILFQSFLVEIGDRCEWLALCFDVVTDEALCAQDANMLGLVLNHEVYIPTDSDEARAFSLPYGTIRTIRINFLKNVPAIEMSYGFFSIFTSGIIHTMQLDSYQRVSMDISKMRVTMARAPGCQGRIANDFAREVLMDRKLNYIQCLTIKHCDCVRMIQ